MLIFRQSQNLRNKNVYLMYTRLESPLLVITLTNLFAVLKVALIILS